MLNLVTLAYEDKEASLSVRNPALRYITGLEGSVTPEDCTHYADKPTSTETSDAPGSTWGSIGAPR